MSEFYSSMQRKARRRHRCDLCGAAILPRKEYIQAKGRGDDGFFGYRFHIHCDAIMQAYASDGCDTDYFDIEAVRDWMKDMACRACKPDGEHLNCEQDVFSCEMALRQALHPTVISAAIASVRENEE